MVTELNALKQAVAALTTKTDGLQTDVTNIKTDVGTIETTVEQIASGGSGNALPVKEVIGGDANPVKEKVLTAPTDYYIYVPYLPNMQTPPKINGNNVYIYLYDTRWCNKMTVLPMNCILKIRVASGSRNIYANNGVVFILDI